jgi:hypothetical protein
MQFINSSPSKEGQHTIWLKSMAPAIGCFCSLLYFSGTRSPRAAEQGSALKSNFLCPKTWKQSQDYSLS